MKFKKGLSLALAVLMMAGSFAACKTSSGGSSGSGSSDTKKTYDKVVFAYCSFNNIPTKENLAAVEETINKITRDKIGVEVTLKPIGIADYSQSVSLALQGGEKIDVFESLGDFNACVASSKAYDITKLVDTCAPETKQLLGNDFLKTTTVNGKLYGIPNYKPYALTPMVIYKKDIADELKIDMTKVKSVYDLTEVLRTVKKAKPNITPLVPNQGGRSGLALCGGDVDYLTDDYNFPKGVLMGNDMKVTDFYSTDVFKNLCNLARTWYSEGLIMKDAATTSSTAAELMSANNSFCYVASYSYPPADTAASLEPQCGGVKLGAVQIGNAYLDTTSINALTFMVSSTSKVPESALKFLNLTYTNADVINAIIYGVKDRDYVLSSDGYVSYPKGQDASTVPYTAQLSCGTLGNYFKMYPMAGTSKDSLTWEEKQNTTAAKSPAMGFSFNSESLKTEYTAVKNVIDQYLPGLLCGSVDPSTTIPKFQSALKDAGFPKILAAKQTQLDAWTKTK